ncbi:MAG: response regulator [Acidimicrobiales bacterium]
MSQSQQLPADGSQNPTNSVRVFLVDDHEVVRAGVRELIEATGEFVVVGEAGTVEEAVRLARGAEPSLAVLDVRLPDGNGIELCRELRSQIDGLRCIMLTSHSDDQALFDAIMAGAAGFVLKQIRGTALIDALRAVAAGQSLLDPELTAKVLDRIRNGSPQDELLSRLTDQERILLGHLGEGLTNREIAERMFLAEKTVKNYLSNVLQKLGMSRRTEAAAYVVKVTERERRRYNDD